MLLLAALCWVQSSAHAHKPSDSYLTLEVKGAQVTGQWDIALRDLDFALNLDHNGDGELTWDEVRSQHQAIAGYALARLELSAGGRSCPLVAGEQLVDKHTDGAYTVLRFSADCGEKVGVLNVGYRLFAELDPQHKGLLKLRHGGQLSTAIFSPGQARQALSLAAPNRLRQFADYVWHGVWHIWIGFDHILFLLSLLLPAVLVRAAAKAAAKRDPDGAASGADDGPASLKAVLFDVLKVVTAFTLAHSITLTLAGLQLVSLPSRLVEASIAASVVLAALNNIFPLFGRRRPLVAFVFGLIHGFGFAGVLAGLGLPQSSLVLCLFGFNVGVELGQLAIVAVFVPLAYLMRATWFYRQLLTTGSALIALIAAVWLAERVFDFKVLPM
ncbi:MAG: HupE/UreJ family protein [Pseudomonadota bacterium]